MTDRRKHPGIKGILLTSAFLASAFLSVGASSALASTGLTIQPVKVSYTLSPGQSVKDTITLTNAGGAANVDTSVQDFIPLAGSSNIQFVGKAAGVTSVADWVSVDAPKSFSFGVGEIKNIPFTVTVPKDAEPGSHFGVVFFKASDASQPTQQLNIGTQVGMLVLVTVPGNHLEKGKIDGLKAPGFIQSGPVGFVMTFENTGTVYFEPKGDISITNMFGRKVGSVPIEGQVVLPTGVRDIAVSWPAGFLIGPYSATANVYSSDGTLIASETVHFFALPIWYIVAVLVIFAAIYGLIVFLKKKVNFSVSLKK